MSEPFDEVLQRCYDAKKLNTQLLAVISDNIQHHNELLTHVLQKLCGESGREYYDIVYKFLSICTPLQSEISYQRIKDLNEFRNQRGEDISLQSQILSLVRGTRGLTKNQVMQLIIDSRSRVLAEINNLIREGKLYMIKTGDRHYLEVAS